MSDTAFIGVGFGVGRRLAVRPSEELEIERAVLSSSRLRLFNTLGILQWGDLVHGEITELPVL